MATNFRVKIG